MRINTITCHNVYNHGAALQAYALCKYLGGQGHQVEIIDYLPEYLRHYSLTKINNPKYDRPIVREAYRLAKLPNRLASRLFSRRKKRFDAFVRDYLPLTDRHYPDLDALMAEPPEADVFIAGSDQIWNPLFKNGWDRAFFLDFVPSGAKRVSYAASFAVEGLSEESRDFMSPLLRRFDRISVRESSGIGLLRGMDIEGEQVLDPVFLLGREAWEGLAVAPRLDGYLLIYDFDASPELMSFARAIAKKRGLKIASLFKTKDVDAVFSDHGPREFLGDILHADCIISNSFHATAFSMIFDRDFYVFRRREGINTRMADLLSAYGLSDRMISDPEAMPQSPQCIDRARLDADIRRSRNFLDGI